MKNLFILIIGVSAVITSCKTMSTSNNENNSIKFPKTITINEIALNPEGIAYNKNNQTFYLSSLNAAPIVEINFDGTFTSFTNGEKFPLSTAGIQIDYKRNRLLVAAFNGTELMDKDPTTKGVAFLRVYNLKTGAIEKDINLSSLLPNASAYFANDIAIDADGNAYISDWYARVIYKVDLNGNPSVFWRNETDIPSGPNGLDFHPDGFLLVSILNVNEKGLYSDYGLVKIPINHPKAATKIEISDTTFSGFDGMVIKENGNIIGVTNDGKNPGGNMLMELTGKKNWTSAKVIHSKTISPSTTVAVTPDNKYYVINQDFSDNFKKTWTIEQIEF